MIEDDELRSLYQVASSEHLANLESGLLFLEKNPQDKRKLEELLRIAHSLKGDSRMLGVKDAETLTHHLEEILSSIHKGRSSFSPSVFEILFTALDGIKSIAKEATTGEPSKVSVFHLVAEMMTVLQEGDAASEIASSSQLSEPTTDSLEQLLALAQPSEMSEESAIDDAQIPQKLLPNEAEPIDLEPDQQTDFIRVESFKLDYLLQYAGELTITQQRLNRQLEVIDRLNTLWQENSQQQLIDRIGEVLPQLYNNLENDSNRLKTITEGLEKDVRSLQLLPFSTIFNLFPRIVRDIAKSQGKDINFVISGGDSLVDRKILEEIKSPLSHLIRNAIDHGLETPQERIANGKTPQGNLSLKGAVIGNQITIEVTDDGRGLNLETIGASAIRKGLVTPAELSMMSPEEIQQLIFRPGFSTKTEVTEISGRGVGLDVVKDTIDRLQGEIKVESHLGLGTTFKLVLRANRSVIPVLLVKQENSYFAIPIDVVVTSLLVQPQTIQRLEDKPVIIWQEQPVPLIFLADYLQQTRHFTGKNYPCVILQINDKYQGLIVTEIVDYQEIQIKPLLLPIPELLGVTMLEDSSICHILNPLSFFTKVSTITPSFVTEVKIAPKKLLLVEDSMPIRTQLRRILESEGYIVTIAVDGADGFQKFRQDNFDAIVSDVEMPNMSGIEMTERIRLFQPTIPIVLVTTLAKPTDREKGLKAGANAYLTKGDFDQSLLLSTLKELIK